MLLNFKTNEMLWESKKYPGFILGLYIKELFYRLAICKIK